MKSKIKIKVVYPAINDQCSWYRAMGPLNHLTKTHPHIEIYPSTGFNVNHWHVLSGMDILFILRPWRKEDCDMILLAKSLNIPVWADFDDDFTVPEECSWIKENMDTKKWLDRCLDLVDYLTVSTESLLFSYPNAVRKMKIPNAMNVEAFRDLLSQINKPRTNTVAWRGSETHDEDLMEIAPEYISLMSKNPDWKTHFYWGNPQFISKYIPSQHTKKALTLFQRSLAFNCHNILMHPLRSTQFNKAKSNAAWLEGTMAGCLVVGKNLPEWIEKPNCVTYRDAKEFRECMGYAMSLTEEERLSVVTLGIHLIIDKYNLAKVNSKRLEVIGELLA